MKKILTIATFIGCNILAFAQADSTTVVGGDVDQATMDSLGLVNPKIAEYYNQGVQFLNLGKNVKAIQKFIKGESYNDAVNGDGLDDYMAFVEAMSGTLPLEEVIDAQIENIILELNSISDPLSKEVVDNNSGVQAVYQEMQKLVPYLKVDMTNALDVLITYQDSDGD